MVSHPFRKGENCEWNGTEISENQSSQIAKSPDVPQGGHCSPALIQRHSIVRVLILAALLFTR